LRCGTDGFTTEVSLYFKDNTKKVMRYVLNVLLLNEMGKITFYCSFDYIIKKGSEEIEYNSLY